MKTMMLIMFVTMGSSGFDTDRTVVPYDNMDACLESQQSLQELNTPVQFALTACVTTEAKESEL